MISQADVALDAAIRGTIDRHDHAAVTVAQLPISTPQGVTKLRVDAPLRPGEVVLTSPGDHHRVAPRRHQQFSASVGVVEVCAYLRAKPGPCSPTLDLSVREHSPKNRRYHSAERAEACIDLADVVQRRRHHDWPCRPRPKNVASEKRASNAVIAINRRLIPIQLLLRGAQQRNEPRFVARRRLAREQGSKEPLCQMPELHPTNRIRAPRSPPGPRVSGRISLHNWLRETRVYTWVVVIDA